MSARRNATLALIVVVLAASASVSAAASAAVPRATRGFDGKTVTVAGIGPLAFFGGADVGAIARFKRANDTNELKGIKIDYVETADDKNDPATATSEFRRLVTEAGVFAIVPDMSENTPGAYMKAQRVLSIGYGLNDTYCSQTPSTSVWSFGFQGCLVPPNPPSVPDGDRLLYSYASKHTGKKKPTMAMFAADNAAGKKSIDTGVVAAEGAGFDVVYAKGVVAANTSDYTPYVQDFLTSDKGHAPDVMFCSLTIECLKIWDQVKASGFKGVFFTPLYSDALVKPLSGTVASSFYNPDATTQLAQVQKDLEAAKPGTKVDTNNITAYFSADMFVKALKTVGKNITPEAVQKALSKQRWAISGLAGPTVYPAATVVSTPECLALVQSDGTSWHVIEKYSCSAKTFKLKGRSRG
jgi:ABC-type branched-subunit amino acid transport system substrate-binding protein